MVQVVNCFSYHNIPLFIFWQVSETFRKCQKNWNKKGYLSERIHGHRLLVNICILRTGFLVWVHSGHLKRVYYWKCSDRK